MAFVIVCVKYVVWKALCYKEWGINAYDEWVDLHCYKSLKWILGMKKYLFILKFYAKIYTKMDLIQ